MQTRSASVGGVIYSLVDANGEMKVRQTAMSDMPADDEESEEEIKKAMIEKGEEENENSIDEESEEETVPLTDEESDEENKSHHTGERKLQIAEKYNDYLKIKEKIRATASILSDGGVNFEANVIPLSPNELEAKHSTRQLQEIKEITIMILWTPQAMCNMAEGKDSCDTNDSKSITMMKDLAALAVEETVSSTLSKIIIFSRIYALMHIS